MNNFKNDGFSLIEVLFAALIFSVSILGLSQYQQNIITQHHHFYSHLKADQIAFQLLDSYPNLAKHIVPILWQYEINTISYTQQCQFVFISIILPNAKKIEQKRLICQ